MEGHTQEEELGEKSPLLPLQSNPIQSVHVHIHNTDELSPPTPIPLCAPEMYLECVSNKFWQIQMNQTKILPPLFFYFHHYFIVSLNYRASQTLQTGTYNIYEWKMLGKMGERKHTSFQIKTCGEVSD